MCATCSAQGSGHWEGDAQVHRDLVATPRSVAFRTAAGSPGEAGEMPGDRCIARSSRRFLKNPSQAERSGFLLGQGEVLWRFQLGFGIFGVSSLQGVREKQGKRREIAA
ncbi:hypothetical protein Taro_047476 [Colocasia esculenta]|uniref:Uncharacterized protein n=1 Tax=Colocasia esculenta TaxID=4460 RepID=A0A843WT21_COLES|nr:hypothetical protein [Colocasia esculenta]